MYILHKYKYIILLLLSFPVIIFGQDKIHELDSVLTLHAQHIPALNEQVSISVSDVTLDEFLRGVANSAGLNLDVQPGIQGKVVNNFTEVKVRDVLIYLCRQFNLDLHVMGSIISIEKADENAFNNSESVIWEEESGIITLDFNNTPIEQVTREITKKTSANVILAPGTAGQNISVYIYSRPLESALEKLAFTNGFTLEHTEDNYYVIRPEQQQIAPAAGPSGNNFQNRRSNHTPGRNGEFVLDIQPTGDGLFEIFAENAPIPDLLKEFSDLSGIDYFLSTKVEGTVTLHLKDESVDKILHTIFAGSEIGFRESKGIYLIGERNAFDFNDRLVIQLQNRSIENILELLPEDMTQNLNVVELPELNSLVVSGPAFQVETFEFFIREIDKVVPVVMIEVVILYVNKSAAVATGIKAGLADEPVATGGTIFPGPDITIGANEINKILNDMGWLNLGKVSPNFYVSLQALEEQGSLDLQSTPKLATLNGHEATLSIGNTEYYLEEQTHLYGTQNPQQTTSQEYKAIEAELSVKIRPLVSADEQITLEIEVNQSDFTERISKTAPPGSVNRDFTSLIRVKNQEMILLGGLMEKRKSNSGSGTPLLSRVPIIKWFFSSRKHEASESKLSVLIKPTIVN